MKYLAILSSLVFLLSTLAGTPGASASVSDATIVFCSDRDGDNEIYVMDADGSNVRRLTDNTSDETQAACSPDGRRVAFVSDRDGNHEIYVMEIEGTGLQRLTTHTGLDLGPSWSRDGMRIAFMSDRDGDNEIHVVNSDGTGLQQLTFNTAIDGFPDFSPDGSRIAFHSNRDGSVDIWTIAADGSDPQQLTNIAAGDYIPVWSPDGSEIVFESERDGPLELYTMNADGSNVVRLTYDFSDNHESEWSPDGSKIVYVSLQGGDYDVMTIHTDGTGLANLTASSNFMDWGPSWRPEVIADSLNGGGTGVLTYTYQPVSVPGLHEIYTINLDGTQGRKVIDAPIGLNHQEWSPDGERFACVGYTDASTWEIFTFDADGTNLRRLTFNSAVWDNEPSFSPDGTRIAWSKIFPSQGYRTELWMMDADGSNMQFLGVAGDMPNWSPDGTRLVYQSGISASDIWTCNADGTNPQQLTTSPLEDAQPDWSPDGTKIAFASNRDGNWEIYVMNPDGSTQRRLTNTAVDEYSPRWSPDGSLIAYGAGPQLEWEVYVMDSTGTNVRRVTNSPPGVTGINPDWQPADSTPVPVYLVGFSCKRDEELVRFAWEILEPAVAADFRLLAGAGRAQREVPVRAAGALGFEAVDDHPGLRAGGEVVYRLLVRGDDGQWDLLRVETVTLGATLAGARLLSVYPNPFNPHTTVSFALSEPQRVRIEIHDPTGRRVTTLVERDYAPGDHRVYWDGLDAWGREVSSGVYFLRLQAGRMTESRKLVLVR